MATLSGKDGELDIGSSTPIDFTDWTLTQGKNTETYAARSGGGAEETAAGLETGSGTISFMMNTETPIQSLISPGDLVTLTCFHRRTGAVQATGQARIGQQGSGANRDGTMQVVTYPFTCHKAWTLPS